MARRYIGETKQGRQLHTSRTYESARNELMAAQNALSRQEKEELLQATTLMGDRIAQAMEDTGTSNRELSVLMEVGERTVSDWKKDGTISLKRLPLLAHHLDCSVEWLLTGKSTEFMSQRTQSESNVVEFQRQAKHEGANMPLIDRFLPAISTAEIAMGRDYVKKVLSENSVNQGQRLGISVAFFNPHVPGIPKFSVQIILPEYGEQMPLGTMVGVADDISPIPGDYVIGNKDHSMVAGFFYPNGAHIASSNRADGYQKLDSFVIKRNMKTDSEMDVMCNHDNFELIGVGTYKTEWLSPSMIEEQTHLRFRMKEAFETRRLVSD